MGGIRECDNLSILLNITYCFMKLLPGVDPGFAERGAKFFGVFRVKNHDFTPKNHIFSILGGGGGAPLPLATILLDQ